MSLATLGPVTFEWFVDDMAVADSNAATLTLQHVPLSDDGAKVRVLVSNSQGEILSQEAVLSVSPETTPPRLISAANLDQSQIAVGFSEPISAGSGERLANYSLSGGLTLLNAAVSPDGLSVVLTTSPLTVGTTYVITVSGIEDRAASPNLIVAGSSIELTAVELIPVAVGGFDRGRQRGFGEWGRSFDGGWFWGGRAVGPGVLHVSAASGGFRYPCKGGRSSECRRSRGLGLWLVKARMGGVFLRRRWPRPPLWGRSFSLDRLREGMFLSKGISHRPTHPPGSA